MAQVKISVGRATLLVDVLDTPTGRAVLDAAPFESRATIWPGEVYFQVPLHAEREDDAREVIEPGEVAFRIEGEAIILGFGPTPCSEEDEIRLASPSNIWGRTQSPLGPLAEVEAGDLVRVELLPAPE